MPTGPVTVRIGVRTNFVRRLTPIGRQLARTARRIRRHPAEAPPLRIDGRAYHRRWRRR